MSRYAIDIDDSVIIAQVEKILDTIIQKELHSRYSDSGKEISSAVKTLIYDHKDEIIDKVVDRAVAEIVKKGLPKFIEKLSREYSEN